MNEFKSQILLALLTATEVQESTTLGSWQRGYWAWRDQAENGIRWQLSALFGPVSDAHRKRLLRALADLETEGLVNTGHRYGLRLTHASLTAAGRAAAASLRPSGVCVEKVTVPDWVAPEADLKNPSTRGQA